MNFIQALGHIRDKILNDGEWHDREEVVAQVVPLIDPLIARDTARGYDYREVRRAKRSELSPEEYRQWVEAHPNRDLYTPTARGQDPAYGARLYLLARVGKVPWIESSRISRPSTTGPGKVLLRLKKR